MGDRCSTPSGCHRLFFAFAAQCGLDKAHPGADMASQEQVFRQHLQLGKELGRPISVSHPAALCYSTLLNKISRTAFNFAKLHIDSVCLAGRVKTFPQYRLVCVAGALCTCIWEGAGSCSTAGAISGWAGAALLCGAGGDGRAPGKGDLRAEALQRASYVRNRASARLHAPSLGQLLLAGKPGAWGRPLTTSTLRHGHMSLLSAIHPIHSPA